MNFRERIERNRPSQDNGAVNIEPVAEKPESTNFYGLDNVNGQPACLELRLGDGCRKALPYSYIMEINFDATEGIEIITAAKRIKITGRKLDRLYEYLVAYRVKYIQENIGTDAGENGLFVTRIEIGEVD